MKTRVPVITEQELRLLQAHFEVDSVWYNESDGVHYGKRLLKATNVTKGDGLILDKSDRSQLVVQVLPKQDRISHSLKRRGIIETVSRVIRLQLNLGD